MAETNPTTHFLYKAIFASIFLLLLPLFPSENTTSWELLQLVFVGIAVSYGLFSKRTNHHKEEVKSDNYYVSRLLQVSSVFDEDDDDDDDDDDDESGRRQQNNTTKAVDQTWSSQYYRGEPILVVANEASTDDATIEKNIVLRSPIPWRSRSGRMELKQTPSQSQQDSSSSSSSHMNESLSSFRYTNPKNKSPIPPPPPPPPPPAQHRYRQSRMKKEFDLQKHKGERMTSASDRWVTSSKSKSKSFRETEYDEYLSHDKEIESFIQTRGSLKKKKEEDQLNTQTEPIEVMMIKKDSDSEEEEDDELVELASKNTVDDHGPDVDKKADEFIAKFREQIRLQRIASVRASKT